MLKTASVVLLALILTAVSLSIQAHSEHQEIQVKSTFEVNQRDEISAITMVWLYDTFSSDDMLYHEKDINRLAKILISDLSRFNFFTRLTIGDRRIVANRVNKYKLIKAKDRDNNPALQLTFTLLLNKPIKINNLETISIDHSDPTGRGIFYYENAKDIVLRGALKPKCKSTVREKEKFIEGHFPQIVSLSCQT